MAQDFDVFISYPSKYKSTALGLVEQLERRGIRPWIDERYLPPGRSVIQELETAIRRSRSVAVLIGESGLGPWQGQEVEAILDYSVGREIPIITVLLPGAAEQPALPIFLRSKSWVDFHAGFTKEGVDRLVWGIRGSKPQPELRPEPTQYRSGGVSGPALPQTRPAPPPPLAKKGTGPLGWVAYGCAATLALSIAFGLFGYYTAKRNIDKFKQKNAAELMVRANPDLELVSTDDAAGTVTVRNKKTHETVAASYEDIKNGKISVANGKDLASFSGNAPKNLPSWLHIYPGATAQSVTGFTTFDGRLGSFVFSTNYTIEQVADYYELQFKSAGLKAEKNMLRSNEKISGGVVSGKSEDGKRSAGVVLSTGDNGPQAVVTYEEK